MNRGDVVLVDFTRVAGPTAKRRPAAVFQEGLFQGADLPIQQVVGRLDQGDNDVHANCRIRVFDPHAKRFEIRARGPVQFA